VCGWGRQEDADDEGQRSGAGGPEGIHRLEFAHMPNIGLYAPPTKGLDKSWLSVLAYSFMEREWKPGPAGARVRNDASLQAIFAEFPAEKAAGGPYI